MSPLHTFALLQLPGLGRRSVARLQGVLTPEAFRSPVALATDLARLWPARARAAAPTPEAAAEALDISLRAHDALDRLGAWAVTSADPAFPAALRGIPDAPVWLSGLGPLAALSCPGLAVVGTRSPSTTAAWQAYALGKGLGAAGVAVVSGLALGVDAQAHAGCLDANGAPTLAVVAHGLARPVYPAANRGLAADLLDAGGCLLSEYAPEATALPAAFAERDRLQSGLAAGVLVVASGLPGGSMITAAAARRQGRALGACVPARADAALPSTAGTRRLLAEGAAPVHSLADALALHARGCLGRCADPAPAQTSLFS